MATELSAPVELLDSELDAVAAGALVTVSNVLNNNQVSILNNDNIAVAAQVNVLSQAIQAVGQYHA